MQGLGEGQKFGRYQVLRTLGKGTAGESYQAEDIFLQRNVLLKLIHPWRLLPEAARRQFFREMESISAITYPYLAAILDYGEVDGQLYIARSYAASGSLLSSEGRTWYPPPLPCSDAILYARQIAQAIHQLHSHAHLHGALTFSNILVLQGPPENRSADFGPFLVADAGNAYFVRRFGQPGVAALPITAAPEQFERRTLPASDQYALAVILYFWLTGHLPFLGGEDEVVRLKRSETVRPSYLLNPQIPLELDGVLRRALSASPEKRYPSMLAFAEALGFVARNVTRAAHPAATEKEQTPPPPQRGPIPQIEPDVPQPLPDPAPLPPVQPVPPPQPPTEPQPKPQPGPLPPPAPDIPQPLPEPTPNPEPASPSPSPDKPATDALRTTGQQAQARHYVVITSPYHDTPFKVALERDSITLGRAGSSDILLDYDSLTSRHHALLQREGDHYLIIDRRSAHGIFVNGQKIESEVGHKLADGDRIAIGQYVLTFHSQTPQPSSCEVSESTQTIH